MDIQNRAHQASASNYARDECLRDNRFDSHKLLGVAGDPADTVFEPQYLQKNVELYRLRNGVPLSTHAAANYIRGEKASNLRKKMSQVDMLLGGYDDEAGPSLCARSPGPPTPTASASPFPM